MATSVVAAVSTQQETSALLPMAMIAIALHALLLTMEALWLKPAPTPSSAPVLIDLLDSSSFVQPSDPPLQIQHDPSTPIDPPPEKPPKAPDTSQPAREEQASRARPLQARPSQSAQRLKEQVLIAAGAHSSRVMPEPSLSEGPRIPRLPGATGWLNEYVGSVDPRMEQWRQADGTGGTRIVRGSGQVLCGRRRAPTMTEEFNPWMFTAVTLWRDCGRERPDLIDRQDPWVRGKGTSQH